MWTMGTGDLVSVSLGCRCILRSVAYLVVYTHTRIAINIVIVLVEYIVYL